MEADPKTLIPVSNSGYVPLPDGSDFETGRRHPRKTAIVVSGLFVVCFVLAWIGYDGSRDNRVVTPPPLREIRPVVLEPVSRGPAAGVSEKANLFVSNNGSPPEYSWNNTVLSWERTAFHFQPEKNWMNDPNGPMFYKGWYHFFYQYNPNGAIWGDIVWGHAVSRDLIHWLHLPLAMVADQWYDSDGVWTGSATILPDGQIVMLYTGSTNESIQVQNLAYPADLTDPLLVRWEKYSGNPVLAPPPGIGPKDFRDPTTAWMTSDGKWRITIGSKMNKTGVALVYETTDFKNYKQLKGLLHAVPGTGMWECVDFFPVSVTAENGLDTSINGPGVKHVMKVSLDDTRHDHYSIGKYNEKIGSWIPDDPRNDVGIGERFDYGVFYASKSFYDQNMGRRVLWGWIGESDSENADIQKGWASVQSIPRTVVLDKKTGTNVVQWPVKETESLRLQSHEFSRVNLGSGSVLQLDVGPATQLDIEAEFQIDEEAINRATESEERLQCKTAASRGALGPFGVLVLADDQLAEQTPVYFYVFKSTGGKLRTLFCSDHSRSTVATDVKKPVYGSTIPVLDGEKLKVRILVDHSIVESFGQGGRRCITSRVYPTKAVYGAARVFAFNNATEANVQAYFKIWQMNSAFIRPYPQS